VLEGNAGRAGRWPDGIGGQPAMIRCSPAAGPASASADNRLRSSPVTVDGSEAIRSSIVQSRRLGRVAGRR
jgi:hypothetical protein